MIFQLLYNKQKNIIRKMGSKRIWSCEEDNFLRQEAKQIESRNWVLISAKLNQKFGGEARSPKQCRQRFINHASTPVEKPFSNEWTSESIKHLFQLYQIYGPRWTTIADKICNKSENIVKNKFYCSLRKFVRKLNKFLKSGKNKYKKQIRYESIIRVMDAFDSYSEMPESFKAWSGEIRKKILQLTEVTIQDEQIPDEMLEQLAENINKFNLQTRSYKAKKSKPLQLEKNSSVKSVRTQSLKHECDHEDFHSENQRDSQYLVDVEKCGEAPKNCDNGKIQSQVPCEQNQKYEDILKKEQLSHEQLFDNFGQAATYKKQERGSPTADIFYQMFPNDFPQYQIDEFFE